MIRRAIAALVVFGTVFAGLGILGLVYRALGDLFWPLIFIAAATAVLFFVLDTVSGWAAPAE
jgi:hypothetical protein